MSAEENNRLTLEGVAQRLEAVERENERMRSENDVLRSKVATMEDSGTRRSKLPALRGSDTGWTGESERKFEEKVSRRAMLTKAGAAAVAAVAAGALLSPREAEAHDTDTDVLVDDVVAHFLFVVNNDVAYRNTSGVIEAISSSDGQAGNGVHATQQRNSGAGVYGRGPVGVEGSGELRSGNAGAVGVRATGLNYPGVEASTGSETHAAVEAVNVLGVGVLGEGVHGIQGNGTGASGVGVLGRNSAGEDGQGEGSTQAEDVAGVRGLGKTGVWGSSFTSGRAGVYGQHTGQGFGVVADGEGSAYAGILGRNNTGSGMRGDGVNGVHGKSIIGGYGGLFEGGKAQLKLVPGSSAGKPTTGAHSKGEIYMDSAGALFVCTADGSPGTWSKITTTLVPR